MSKCAALANNYKLIAIIDAPHAHGRGQKVVVEFGKIVLPACSADKVRRIAVCNLCGRELGRFVAKGDIVDLKKIDFGLSDGLYIIKTAVVH